MIIEPKHEILKYLEYENRSRKERKLYCGSIELKTPNLSEDASESLGCHLIIDGHILNQLHPISKIERKGRHGKDILVNNYHKLEVKGTSSADGIITTSDSNFESFAWIWIDFRPFFEYDNYIIPVHVITNPKDCVILERYVDTLLQKKLSLVSVIKYATMTRNYTRYEFSLRSMSIIPSVDFFG